MKKSNLNIYIIIASLSAFIYTGIGRFVKLPEIVKGISAGITIGMFLIGAYVSSHDASKLRSFKRKLLGRLIKL